MTPRCAGTMHPLPDIFTRTAATTPAAQPTATPQEAS